MTDYRTITLLFKIATAFCLPFIWLQANSQISLFYNETPVAIPQNAISYYRDSSANRTIVHYHTISKYMQPMVANNVNLSYKNEMLWLRLNMQKIMNWKNLHYLMVRNPHINYIGCWALQKNKAVSDISFTGDHSPFNSRIVRHPDFVFPVLFTDLNNSSLLLLIDKRNEQLHIPIHLFTEQSFITYNQHSFLLAGIMTGIGMLLFLLNLFLYFKMKERLYVFYGLYVLMAFLYIFSDYGLSFMYLFPGFYALADFTRPITISLAAPLYVLFSIQLLNVKSNFPVVYKWLSGYLWVYLAILIGSVFLLQQNGIARSVLLVLLQGFQFLHSIIILGLAINSYRKKIKYSGYMIAASLVLLICFSLFSVFLSGYLPDTLFTRNLLNIGFTLEISLLAFVLTLRFRDYKVQSETLLRQVNVQQEQIFKTLSDYREKEMQRISSQLHDSVGASLSAIRLNLESAQQDAGEGSLKVSRSVQQISELANEVREISHGLSPILLQKNGLIRSIQSNIDSINSSKQIQIQFESIGSLQKVSFRYELLVYNVVQELIQNIIKHSRATEAIVQLMLEYELVSVYVEDNGQCFKESEIEDGLGFLQIKQLVTFVNGRFQIQAIAGGGCQVSIEFPVLPDEHTHTHSHS